MIGGSIRVRIFRIGFLIKMAMSDRPISIRAWLSMI